MTALQGKGYTMDIMSILTTLITIAKIAIAVYIAVVAMHIIENILHTIENVLVWFVGTSLMQLCIMIVLLPLLAIVLTMTTTLHIYRKANNIL